jgi:trehalose 6-phosphate synthase
VLESRTDREHMTASRNGHVTTVRPYPVSVALDNIDPVISAKRPTRDDLLSEFGVHAESMVVGVDRLDYTKGIVERLVAIEKLLEVHPWHIERLTMVQIAAPSRTRIPSYLELQRRVVETVERINQRFQTAQWKPILLIERQCTHEEVERWYRAAEVCLVTSLHDGMNLVAKEFVAARDDEDGVLVLSRFTGAAIELGDALLVNPYDIESVAEAVHQGLEMPRAERRARMQRMRRQVMEHNIYRWAATLLADLRELRIEGAGPGRAGPVIVPAQTDTKRRRA